MVPTITGHIIFLFGMWYVLLLIKKKKRQKKKVFPGDVSSNSEVIGANISEFSYSQLFLLTASVFQAITLTDYSL